MHIFTWILDSSLNFRLSQKHVDGIRKKDKPAPETLTNSENEEDMDMKIVPNAMFPFCGYNNDYSEGVLVNEYDERYCSSFQVMVNTTYQTFPFFIY